MHSVQENIESKADKLNKAWDELSREYEIYIRLEKRLSPNSVESYMRDLRQFREYVVSEFEVSPLKVDSSNVESFLAYIYDKGVRKTTQARLLSGIKSFYTFLVVTDKIEELPTEFIDAPKIGRKLPDVLSVSEIDAIVAAVDLSSPLGHRNKAIFETLYSCGIRVSELVSLKTSDLFFEDGFIRVIGKGDKQRLVPVSDTARKYIELYQQQRRLMPIDPKSEDILFLNRRGKKLTRVMIFTMLREAADKAGIKKSISPHTMRHSFATHLLSGGADIRQVQEMLGHESVTTTEVYTHLDRSHLKRSMEEHHPLATGIKSGDD